MGVGQRSGAGPAPLLTFPTPSLTRPVPVCWTETRPAAALPRMENSLRGLPEHAPMSQRRKTHGIPSSSPQDMGGAAKAEHPRTRRERIDRKARLRRFHEESTKLGHVFWGVSQKTWQAWLSDNNRRDVPQRVIAFIDGEAEYDRSKLGPPGRSGTGEA